MDRAMEKGQDFRRRYWFNSHNLIDRCERLRLLQNRPDKHPDNPIMVTDRPWEGSLIQLFAAVHRDPDTGRWQMWYEGHPSGVNLCVAFSNDGLRWEKPDLDGILWNGQKTNIVLDPGYWDAHMPAVVMAPNETNPERKYKIYYWVGPEWYNPNNPVVAAAGNRVTEYKKNGWYVAFSPDGLRWTPMKDRPVLGGRVSADVALSGGAGQAVEEITIGDFNTVLFDAQRGLYRSYHKLNKRLAGWDAYRRCLGMAESEDGVHFQPSISVLDPDEEDDRWAREGGGVRAEFYGMHVWPLGGFYLGLLWMFMVTRSGQPPYGRGWDDGTIAPHLVYSPDGITWSRLPVREPFIPLGPAGSFEAGTMYTAMGPVSVGDTLRFYYHGCSYTHGWTEPIDSPNQYTGIALATMSRDRYVAWQASAYEGILQTHPLTFTGRALVLNINASRGESRVALLNAEGEPLPGFGLEDCIPITGDHLYCRVAWRGGSDLSRLAGQPVRLKFSMRYGALYTCEFVA